MNKINQISRKQWNWLNEIYGKDFTKVGFLDPIQCKNSKQYTSNSYSSIHTTV